MATVNGTTLTDTVTGLSAGVHTVTVTALNAIGESVASNTQSFTVAGTATLPGAPTNVSAAAGTNQATITFSAPSSNGGATITSYIVTSAGQAVVTASGSGSPITITGLAPGTYTFSVKAVNSAGQGPSSSSTSAITVTASVSVPGAPTNVSATPGTNSAVVYFSAPSSNGGSAITSYTVISAGQAVAVANGSGSPISITGLAAGNYTFTVVATNSAGTGAASAPSSAITVSSQSTNTVPGAPTNVTVTTAPNSATVSFTPPSNNGGSAITSYTAISAGQAVVVANGSSSPITFTGLAAGNYTFTVLAANSLGTGSASAPSATVTISNTVSNTVPGVPTNVSATGGQTQATVTWTAPSSNGGATITGYTVTSSGPTVKTTTSTGTSTTVTGLAAGSYTFTVAATNSVGTGSASSASSAVTITASSSGITATNLLPATVAAVALGTASYTSGPGGATPTLAASTAVSPGVTGSSVQAATMSTTTVTGTKAYWAPIPSASTCAVGTAGTTYSALIYYNPAASGVSCSSQLMWYDTNFNLISYSKGTITVCPQGQWTALVATAAAPANTAFVGFQPTVDVAANGNVIYVSCFEVAASSTVNTWTSGQGVVATVPGAPTLGTVTPGAGQATVAFTAPSSNGGSPITSYTVTATSQ